MEHCPPVEDSQLASFVLARFDELLAGAVPTAAEARRLTELCLHHAPAEARQVPLGQADVTSG
jgi:hypothetical protein